MNPLSIVYMGTPLFAVPALRMLHQEGHPIMGVFTQPDRPRGRGHRLQPSPVKAEALALGLKVYQPLSLRRGEDAEEAYTVLQQLAPDLIVVAAYGQILPKEILALPKYGCINLHASLLPRWRGAAPIQRAILAGDTATGVTAMQMAVGLDTGDMLYKLETPIAPDETADTLHDRLSEMSAKVLHETLRCLEEGTLTPEVQNDLLACTAEKITKEMSRLDFDLPAQTVDRTIRALSGYAMLGGKRIKLHRSILSNRRSDAAPGAIVDSKTMEFVCGDGLCVIPLVVQMEGGRAMTVADLLRGTALQPNDCFQTAE